MKRVLWLIFCLGAFKASAQQDTQYSQYVFNGLFINPAYAGYKQDLYLQGFFRSQWTGLVGAPQSYSLSADGAIANGDVGLGLLLAQDKIGAQSSFATYANYAYRLQVGESEESRLSFGIGVGFIQSVLDGSLLHAVQDNDTYVPTGSQSLLLPDARAGVLFTNEDFFAGFSVDNLIASHIKTDNTLLVPIPKPHYYLTTGALFTFDEDLKFKPSILLKDDAAGPTSLDINTFFLLGERIWVGTTYRTAVSLYPKPYLQSNLEKSNSISALVEFFATEKLRVGYSFDQSLTSLGNGTYGTHEISIGISFGSGIAKAKGLKCYF